MVFKNFRNLNKSTALGKHTMSGVKGKFKGLKANCKYTQGIKSMESSVVDLECDWEK